MLPRLGKGALSGPVGTSISIVAVLLAKFFQANAATGHNKAENKVLFTLVIVKPD